VYWTLGIEFQFYLVIGLTFSFINRSANSVITASILIFFTSFIHSARMQLVFQYLPIFGMGIIVYFYLFKKNLSGTSFGLLFLIFLVQIYFQDGLPTLVASLLTVLTLNYWTYNHRLFDFLSNISFSLYLTHTIIGGKIINLGLRFVSYPFQRYLLFLLAFFVSLAFAYLFYIFIEKPFIALGKKVHYKIP
jgi:peptidoglycan/LPS O-acetylase OafA/YrhL